MTRKEFIEANEDLVADMIRENTEDIMDEVVSSVTIYPQEPNQVILTVEHYLDELMSNNGVEITF